MIPFGLQYEDGERIAALVSPERPIALLENDGVLVLGTSVLDAFDRLEVLEATAEAVINSRAIGDVRRMSDDVIEELVQAFLHGEESVGVTCRPVRAATARERSARCPAPSGSRFRPAAVSSRIHDEHVHAAGWSAAAGPAAMGRTSSDTTAAATGPGR